MADDAKVAALKSYSKVLHEHEKVSGDLKNGALSQRMRKNVVLKLTLTG